MTSVEELRGLCTAWSLARAERDQAWSPIDAERWECRMRQYADDIAAMVVDADLDVLAGAR